MRADRTVGHRRSSEGERKGERGEGERKKRRKGVGRKVAIIMHFWDEFERDMTALQARRTKEIMDAYWREIEGWTGGKSIVRRFFFVLL